MSRLAQGVLGAGVLVALLAGCSTKTPPQADNSPQNPSASPETTQGGPSNPAKQRVTLYVEGMTKVQGIT